MILTEYSWPPSRLDEAVAVLAQQSGLIHSIPTLHKPPEDLINSEQIGRWLEATATSLGIETKPTAVHYSDVTHILQTQGPAIIQLSNADKTYFLALLQYKRNKLFVLGSDLCIHQIPMQTICDLLYHEVESQLLPEIEQLLDKANVSTRRRAKARTAFLNQQLRDKHVTDCWLLEASPSSNFWQQLGQAGVLRQLVFFFSTHTIFYLLFLLSWWLIGRSVFQGRIETGWLWAWVLTLLTLVPLRVFAIWLQGVVAITIGGLVQKRLLYGTLRLHPDEIRHQGAGQLMGRVFEADAIESLAINGGLLGITALIELALSVWVLSQGAGKLLHVFLLGGWIVVLGWFSYRYHQRFKQWSSTRRDMTHNLIENMVGHRTRLAQMVRQHWHDGEDEALVQYIQESTEMDMLAARLTSLVARGWLVVGLAGLLPAIVSDQSVSLSLAVGIGGVLSANMAFRKLTTGLFNLIGAAVAWDQIAPLFRAAARPQRLDSAEAIFASTMDESPSPQPILAAYDLIYRFPSAEKPVLQGCNLQIYAGDRILLEGESGEGKSTLAAILTGLRQPDSGLLLLNGLDCKALGSTGWQRFVAAAPQFHENHVFGDTFLFNMLMGKDWPPKIGDMARAREICEELGLGPLLDSMPGGLLQMVGEIGWQLSHGERSRLYIARALLQEADLIILDESFAALDPENLQRVVQCVQKRAKALLVIAHP